jgi:hypothetical protein
MPIVPLLALLLVAWVVRRVMTEGYLDRGLGRGTGPDPEVARLREEVDDLSAKVRRLSEEHAFMVSLLAPGSEPPAVGAGPVKTETNEIRNPETPDGDA